jgi:hypothetical protein
MMLIFAYLTLAAGIFALCLTLRVPAPAAAIFATAWPVTVPLLVGMVLVGLVMK